MNYCQKLVHDKNGETGSSAGSLYRRTSYCSLELVSEAAPREREVLARIGQGRTNKHIAKALRLSVKTVEKHRSNLMRKLGLHNTAAVTVYAMRQGLVSQ